MGATPPEVRATPSLRSARAAEKTRRHFNRWAAPSLARRLVMMAGVSPAGRCGLASENTPEWKSGVARRAANSSPRGDSRVAGDGEISSCRAQGPGLLVCRSVGAASPGAQRRASVSSTLKYFARGHYLPYCGRIVGLRETMSQ